MNGEFKLAAQVLGIISLTSIGLAMFPTLIYYGTWLTSRAELCRDQVSNTGASGNLSLYCETRGARITIERAGQSVVAMCRCNP